MSVASAAERLYIHETIEITVRHRQAHLKHFLSWGEISRRLHGMTLCGVWAVNGSTHRWPEAVVLWELDGVDGFAKLLSGEYAHLRDPALVGHDHYSLYWSHAPEGVVDRRGEDRLMAPTAYTPGIETLIGMGLHGAGYLHETFNGPPGSMNEHLERLGRDWRPTAEALGLKLVGAYRSMLRNDDEAIAIWAIPAWADWARYELALEREPAALAWRSAMAQAGIGVVGKLLNAVAGAPLETGRLT